MEEAYGNLNAAYLQIKGMVVIEGFYALIAGFVITTFVFKLVGIIKEMINEGKGFNAKHFYELGREYIFCIGLICIMPVLLGTLETVLAYGADEEVGGQRGAAQIAALLDMDDADYDRATLERAVLDHRYELQAVLYLLALHRHLRERLPDYDCARHLGGAVYLFLRGWDGAGQGVWHACPDAAHIDALDALFAGQPLPGADHADL